MTFDTFKHKRQVTMIEQPTLNNSHQRLQDNPPTRILCDGQVGHVDCYLWDFLWAVRFGGQVKIVHELDADFLSQDVLRQMALVV